MSWSFNGLLASAIYIYKTNGLWLGLNFNVVTTIKIYNKPDNKRGRLCVEKKKKNVNLNVYIKKNDIIDR